MNKSITPILLLILAIGIYFTFTRAKIEELKTIKSVNASYQQALDNSEKLIKVRDQVLNTYNAIDETNRLRLEKMVPDNIDNVRLIIDVKGIGLQHGLILKNLKTSTPGETTSNGQPASNVPATSDSDPYNIMTLSFEVSASYQSFVDLLKTLEASLRIMDISSLDIEADDTNTYDFKVELNTYWLKQK
jgi:Tfp pilus assembly protein PilO